MTASNGQLASSDPASESLLLKPFKLGSLALPNRVVMAPMTRNRTLNADGVPTALEAEYFCQRASAGLMITGGTFISPQAIGAMNVAGIYTEQQVEGWRGVTDAVHKAGGRIFCQIVHSGAATDSSLLGGSLPVAPSAVNPEQRVFTKQGFVRTVQPHALTIAEIASIVEDYRRAAANAKDAGFDGVELHAGNVFLVPQFLNASTNRRDDAYGGSPAKRARFPIEVLTAMGAVWGADRVGIKLSPTVSGINGYTATDFLISWLAAFRPAYLHLRRGFNTNGQQLEQLTEFTLDHFRDLFDGTLIGNGGFDFDSASDYVNNRRADLISFAKHFVPNPDLVARFENNQALSVADPTTYYSGGAHGYTDYPIFGRG